MSHLNSFAKKKKEDFLLEWSKLYLKTSPRILIGRNPVEDNITDVFFIHGLPIKEALVVAAVWCNAMDGEVHNTEYDPETEILALDMSVLWNGNVTHDTRAKNGLSIDYELSVRLAVETTVTIISEYIGKQYLDVIHRDNLGRSIFRE